MRICDVIEYIEKSRSKFKGECKKYLLRTYTCDAAPGAYCPITFVAKAKLKKEFPACEYEDAAKALGIRPRDARVIADSADGFKYNMNTKGNKKLRKKLFEAVGLDPEIA